MSDSFSASLTHVWVISEGIPIAFFRRAQDWQIVPFFITSVLLFHMLVLQCRSA
jgi:hypothetical protein